MSMIDSYPSRVPGIWVYTAGSSFNSSYQAAYPDFLSDEQKVRTERLRQAQLLFDGKHRQYFLDERRSQFDFPPSRAGDRLIQTYVSVNILGLVSLKGADLLFGQEPLLRVDDPIQQEYISAMAQRCRLHSLLHAAAVDCSYQGEAIFEACITYGQVYLVQIDAAEISPEGGRRADGQYGSYARFDVNNIGTKENPLYVLLKTRYLMGSIERKLYQLNPDKSIRLEIGLENWPNQDPNHPFRPSVSTGIRRNTVVVHVI